MRSRPTTKRKQFTVSVEDFQGADPRTWILSTLQQAGTRFSSPPKIYVEPEAEEGSPAVSVILPVYNHASRLGGMLSSLAAQSFQDFELIVVDDGSADDAASATAAFMNPGPVSQFVVHCSNQGAAGAINTGAELARGKFWTWVSADNVMTSDWLERLVNAMRCDVGVSYANYDRFNESGPIGGLWGKSYDPERLINDVNCYIGPAFLVRADVWRAAGALRGKNSCDYDHWLRIEEACMAKGLALTYDENVLCHYYGGPERATVARKQDYDAPHWQAEARKRRAELSRTGL